MFIGTEAPLLKEAGKIFQHRKVIPASVAVVFVMSVLGKTCVRDDYEGFSISASFQREKDLDDYISAVRGVGIYVQSFLDEREFFKWVIDGHFEALPQRYKFVYTSAVNGTGPGRRALVPAFCAHFKIPTLNQNPYSSTLGRHKHHTAYLLRSLGVLAADSWLIDETGSWLGNRRPSDGKKIIAKASYEGSSIGLDASGAFFYSNDNDDYFIELSHRLRQPVTVQEFLSGAEYEVPVFECHGLVEPWPQALLDTNGAVSGECFLDYEKVWSDDYSYGQGRTIHVDTGQALKNAARAAHAILGYQSIARIDLRIDQDGRAKVFDVSGTPDLSTMSSCASAVAEMGGSYSDLWLLSIASAIARQY